MIDYKSIQAARLIQGGASTGIEVLVNGVWLVYATGPYVDDDIRDLQSHGITVSGFNDQSQE